VKLGYGEAWDDYFKALPNGITQEELAELALSFHMIATLTTDGWNKKILTIQEFDGLKTSVLTGLIMLRDYYHHGDEGTLELVKSGIDQLNEPVQEIE
jgi:hypothetical protein